MGGSIGRRYAKALLDLGSEQKKVDDFLKQLLTLQSLLKSSQDIAFLLTDPAFEAQDRKKVFQVLAQKLSLNPVLQNFLKLLIDRERMSFFDNIVSSYQEQADDMMKRVRVNIKSATSLNEEEERRLKKIVEKITGKEAILASETDSKLLGGVVIKVRDMVFDGSLKNALHQLKENMLNVGV